MTSLVIFALLGACAGAGRPTPTPGRINQAGYSPAFKQGYADGCESVQASRRRDERRYRSDADYMMGWNDGYSACGR